MRVLPRNDIRRSEHPPELSSRAKRGILVCFEGVQLQPRRERQRCLFGQYSLRIVIPSAARNLGFALKGRGFSRAVKAKQSTGFSR